MGFSRGKWELVRHKGIYGTYGSYTLSWGLSEVGTQKPEFRSEKSLSGFYTKCVIPENDLF